ncbi:MAG: LON peptidase substrate-binding domain-containing protein [Dehalococcoidia bacterium]
MPLIPLFPLNTVLFPGATLPLHIFEPRYRLMLNECIDAEAPFGVVLIRGGVEVGGEAQPHEIGTTARVARVERLPDGRMNLVSVGVRRFRIHSLDRSLPYLRGEVEYCERDGEPEDATAAAATVVRDLYSAYFRLMLSLGGQWTGRVGVPGSPPILADFIGGRIEAEPALKQEMLEAPTVLRCLEIEREMLAPAVAGLQARVSALQREKFSGFGALN